LRLLSLWVLMTGVITVIIRRRRTYC
jgi:hypothetical protein